MSPFDPAGLKVRLEEIDKKVNENGFWDDPEAAQKVMKEKKSIEDKLSELDALEGQMEDLEVMIEMADEEQDEAFADEAEEAFGKLSAALEDLRLRTLLNGKYDKNNAIISVHAGQAVRMPRTGRRCFFGCIPDGVKRRVTRLSS